MAENTILELKEVTKRFGGVTAIDAVSFEVLDTETISIIGPNGAGKTTLFNLITGLLSPDSGQIRYRDENIQGYPTERRVDMGIGRSFQITNVFPEFTVFDNVHIAVQTNGGHNRDFLSRYDEVGDSNERTTEILESIGLVDKRDTTAKQLSYGDKRILELGITLGLDPELLLLDEPTAGMSHEEADKALSIIESLGESRTILFIEHNMEAVLDISDRILVLDQGERVTYANPENVQNNPHVKRIYMGETRDNGIA